MTFMTDTQKAPPTWGDAFCALGNSGDRPPLQPSRLFSEGTRAVDCRGG